jgi:hypothetical protein
MATANPTQQSILNRSSKDKFLLVLNLPPVLKKRSIEDKNISIDPLQVSVHGSVVPTISVPPQALGFGGQTYNVTSYARPNYAPLKVNFIVDNSFNNYYVLWKWLSILNDPRESEYSGTPPNLTTYKDNIEAGLPEYQTNISLLALNEYNESILEFTYYNAFITTLGGIDYSYRTSDLIESSAEFQFSQLDIKKLL